MGNLGVSWFWTLLSLEVSMTMVFWHGMVVASLGYNHVVYVSHSVWRLLDFRQSRIYNLILWKYLIQNTFQAWNLLKEYISSCAHWVWHMLYIVHCALHRPGAVFILGFHMMRNRWILSKIKGKEVWSMTKVIMMGSQNPGEQVHIFCLCLPSALCFTFTVFFFFFSFFNGWSRDVCLFSPRPDSHQINLW